METCGRCYKDGPVHDANCDEKPELLKGKPIGMYHCPDCGAMLLAGSPHPKVCYDCLWKTNPELDGQTRNED